MVVVVVVVAVLVDRIITANFMLPSDPFRYLSSADPRRWTIFLADSNDRAHTSRW